MKNQSLSTPSPPKLIFLGALVFLILIWGFLTPSALAQQDFDNLVKLKPGAAVWNIGEVDFGWIFGIEPQDPSVKWDLPANTQWIFVNQQSDWNFTLSCFANHCGLRVNSIVNTKSNDQIVHGGVVFLEDIDFSSEQLKRAKVTVDRELSLTQQSEAMVRIYSGLLKWDKSYAVKAYEAFLKVGDGVSYCDKKEIYYFKAADLAVKPEAGLLLRKVKQAKEEVGNDCIKITSQAFSGATAQLLVAQPPAIIPPVAVPAVTVIPQTVIVDRVITTTPAPTAVIEAVPTPTAVSFSAPIPLRNPGEKDLGEQFAGAFWQLLKLLLLLSCLAIFAIACIIGGSYLIRYIQEVQAKEKQLKAEFVQQQQERLAEGKTKLEGLLARAKELLGIDEQAVLSEAAQKELIELLYVKIPPLLIFHEQGLAIGQAGLSTLLLRFKKQRRNKTKE